MGDRGHGARWLALALILGLAAQAAGAEEWPSWRGPQQNGVSSETGLISGWSKGGENLIWRQPFTGRSTPAVFDGRVCANGRTGSGITMQEVVACWDAGDGTLRWERRFPVYHTTVPFSRVGWASVTGDPATGYLYANTADGRLLCLDREGKTVWEWLTAEELGRTSGYGGRTLTPVVDEDRLIMAMIHSAWGSLTPLRMRYVAFDKRTGEILWTSTLGTGVEDLNTQSTPMVAVLGGQRLLLGGGAEGVIYAVKARTGEPVWRFSLSQRGIQTSMAVAGNLVIAGHSEENVDEGVMGRVVAIDGTGSGDVTKTHERWRIPYMVGFSSPLVQDGRVYVLDNSANFYAADAATGKVFWQFSAGTVGKSSAVWADGKIYLTEVNGHFLILKPADGGATLLDEEFLQMPDGRYAEIYGSPAVAYGRIYFTTEEGVYCLGDPARPFRAEAAAPVVLAEEPAAAGAAAAHVQVMPAVVYGRSGETLRFRVETFDDRGRALGPAQAVSWSVEGLAGEISPAGELRLRAEAPNQVGKVVAKVGALQSAAEVRVTAPLPWSEDFESFALGGAPKHWLRLARGSAVVELDGSKVLQMPPAATGVPRAEVFLGPASMSGYTVQADVRGSQEGRKRPDLGLLNSGYAFDLQGGYQRLEIRSWAAELRVVERLPFEWQMDTWYTLKMRVDLAGDKAVVRGKAWPRDQPEPEAWTLTAEDPMPVRHGSPGIYGYSPVNLYFDNVKVMVNE